MTTTFNAKGVAHQSAAHAGLIGLVWFGLGYPEGVSQLGRYFVEPRWGTGLLCDLIPACASRRWALLWNAFGVLLDFEQSGAGSQDQKSRSDDA
jgi:hypothetical protein